MRRVAEIFIGVALVVAFAAGVDAQQNVPTPKAAVERAQPLVLTETIPLEGIKGLCVLKTPSDLQTHSLRSFVRS
jgi:hypothetical protein